MFQKILDIVLSIINLLKEKKKAENIKNSKSLDDAKKDIEKKQKELDKKADKMNDAINAQSDKGDAQINAFLGKVLGLSLLVMLVGCSTPTVYVSKDSEVKSITYEGVEGKFVPNATFSKMIRKLIEYDNLLLEIKAKESINR